MHDGKKFTNQNSNLKKKKFYSLKIEINTKFQIIFFSVQNINRRFASDL